MFGGRLEDQKSRPGGSAFLGARPAPEAAVPAPARMDACVVLALGPTCGHGAADCKGLGRDFLPSWDHSQHQGGITELAINKGHSRDKRWMGPFK